MGFSQGQMLSPTGTSTPFDERANGFVRAEGCVALLLQRSDLSKHCSVDSVSMHALATVRAVGVNEDGKTRSLTFPSYARQVYMCLRYAPFLEKDQLAVFIMALLTFPFL